jgi:hypothetical protein
MISIDISLNNGVFSTLSLFRFILCIKAMFHSITHYIFALFSAILSDTGLSIAIHNS